MDSAITAPHTLGAGTAVTMMNLKNQVSSCLGPGRGRSGRNAKDRYGKKPPGAPGSSLRIGLPLAGLLAGLLFLAWRYWIRQKPDGAAAPIARLHEQAVGSAPVAWRGLQPAQIAAGFLTASTRQERLRWVRKPAAVADVMDRYYRDGPGAFEKIADIQKMPLPAAEGSVLERFVVTMTDGSSRLLCVPVDESGGGVDFKSYARHCSAPWSALLDGTVAKAAEMRVLL